MKTPPLPRLTRRRFGYSLAGMVLAAASRRAMGGEIPWSRREPHMGCEWTLTLPGTPPALAEKAAAAVFAEIARLNQIFSDYETGSELNRLCATAGSNSAISVSGELFAILSQARAIAEFSQGMFDVTLGPCTRLWRRSRRRGELPDTATLAEARSRCGWQAVELDAAARSVRLTKPRMQLDLGGIAKGWTQDACLRLLADQFHIRCVLLDAAGEVAAGTPPPGRDSWQIGLESSGRETSVRIALREANVATSGDHYQFVEIGGTRYSHIIDPRTGLGATTSRQASLIAPQGAIADPLTKFLCLTDPAESLPRLTARWPELQARVSVQGPGGALETVQTPGFPLLL